MRNWAETFRAVSRGGVKSSTASFGASSVSGFGGGTPSTSDVQAKLNSLGFAKPPLVVDGAFGRLSQAALAAFDSAHGLPFSSLPSAQALSAMGFANATQMVPSHAPNQVILPTAYFRMNADQMGKALSKAHQKVAGKVPSPQVLSLMLAQTAFETRAKDDPSIWNLPNYNIGGMKAATGDPYAQVFQTHETIHGVDTVLPQTFAAYKNVDDGAEAYVKLLNRRPNWWGGLQSGTPEGFLQGLTGSPAYFTGNQASYLAGVKSLFNQYFELAKRYAVPIAEAGLGIAGIVILAIGGFAAWEILKGSGKAG